MSNERKMLVWITRIVLAAFLIIEGKMIYLQIFKSGDLQRAVTEQRVKEIPEVAERGKITDRNGNVLAMSLMAQDIAVYPNLMTSKTRQERVAKLLSDTLDLNYDYVLKQTQTKDANDKKKPATWASIAKGVDPEKAYKVKKANIGGIEIRQSPKRYYPNNSLGSSILGFINTNGEPVSGVERAMNSYLAGVPGYKLAETDNLGKPIPVGFQNISSPLNGQDVHLTIDNYIQYVLEQRLKQGMKEMNPKSIHGIVMNPKTGEILAMASYPSYDPNKWQKADPANWTRTPANYVFEPGSIMKPVYMAMALDNGYVNENTSWYDSSGGINVSGTTIHNDKGEVYGKLDLRSIIVHSSNVGMIHISQQMTSQQVVDGLKKIGIGQKTGVELPGEEYGLTPTVKMLENDPLMKATESFGQGISVTQVQMASIFSSIINGGYKVTPKLVKDVKDNHGNVLYSTDTIDMPREFKSKTSELMKSYLNANMHEGTGKNYQIDGYEAGGKTGSAWVVENGRYKDGVIVGSFLGFAPLDDPEVVTLITVDQPEGIGFGALSAGPIWHDVMTETLRYLSVPKENEKETKEIKVPNVEEMFYDDAKQTLEKSLKNVTVKKSGKGEVVSSQVYTYKNGDLHVTLSMKKLVSGSTLNMPNLIGKSKEEVKDLFSAYKGIQIEFHGDGYVKEQNINPGQTKKQKIILWLE